MDLSLQSCICMVPKKGKGPRLFQLSEVRTGGTLSGREHAKPGMFSLRWVSRVRAKARIFRDDSLEIAKQV